MLVYLHCALVQPLVNSSHNDIGDLEILTSCFSFFRKTRRSIIYFAIQPGEFSNSLFKSFVPILCNGVSTPLKNTSLFFAKPPPPPLTLQTVQAHPFFRQFPPIYWVFETPCLKIRFFSESPYY